MRFNAKHLSDPGDRVLTIGDEPTSRPYAAMSSGHGPADGKPAPTQRWDDDGFVEHQTWAMAATCQPSRHQTMEKVGSLVGQ